MQIDTAGTYTLKYTAEDACGNVTEVTREVEAIQITYRTVLYTDGTFIINEKSTDQAANEALHGVATNVYDPYNPNNSSSYSFGTASQRPWNGEAGSVKAVEIGSPISPLYTAQWFRNFSNCTSMDFTNLDTSRVTSMRGMFAYCSSMQSLDLTDFDTQNVTDMYELFDGCGSLTSVNISSFNTSKVTTMAEMFNACYELEEIDVSSFDTSNVTTMADMFHSCQKLKSIDLSNFDTRKVTSMVNMFYLCKALQSIDLSNFYTPNLKDMQRMFASAENVTIIDISNFSSSRIDSMRETFYYCQKLQTVYASPNFTGIYASGYLDTFGYCSTNLVGGAGTVWNGNQVSSRYARVDGGTSNPGYFTLKPSA